MVLKLSGAISICFLTYFAPIITDGNAWADGEQSLLADPDTQTTRRHYDRGAVLYDQGRYAEAASEFEAARHIKALPAFEFNIARCHDRLEQWAAAADGYERYLAADPDAPQAAELRKRVVTLRARVSEPVAPVTPTLTQVSVAPLAPLPVHESSSIARRWWFWTAIGAVVTVVVAGVAWGGGGQHAAIPATTDGNVTLMFP